MWPSTSLLDCSISSNFKFRWWRVHACVVAFLGCFDSIGKVCQCAPTAKCQLVNWQLEIALNDGHTMVSTGISIRCVVPVCQTCYFVFVKLEQLLHVSYAMHHL